MYDYVIRAERTHAYLYGVKETVPFYCSEGDLKTPIVKESLVIQSKTNGSILTKSLLIPIFPKIVNIGIILPI